MSRQLFRNDFSSFSGGPKKTVSKSMVKNFPTDMERLERSTWNINNMESIIAGRINSGLSEHFIIYGKTTKTKGKDFLTALETWHVNDHISLMHKKRSTVMNLVQQMRDRLVKNPIGVKAIPEEDKLYIYIYIYNISPTQVYWSVHCK